MAVTSACALGAAILGGQATYRTVPLPWWAEFALAVLALMVMCLTMCLRSVVPQNSPDRLALWLDGWRPRRRSARRSARCRSHRPVGAAATQQGGEADNQRQAPAGTDWRGPAS